MVSIAIKCSDGEFSHWVSLPGISMLAAMEIMFQFSNKGEPQKDSPCNSYLRGQLLLKKIVKSRPIFYVRGDFFKELLGRKNFFE